MAKPDYSGYLRIARFDHATKHVFIIPGILMAYLLRSDVVGITAGTLISNIIIGMIAAVCIASANYVINEWLDREFDKFHPEKSQRAAVQIPLNPVIVYTEYAFFVVVGLGLAYSINMTFFWVSVLFAIAGVCYNVEPMRSKDKPFVDVLSESLNNPLRLLLGWAMVDPTTLPPASLMLAFWFGGAFLMNSKRLAEYRDIVASDGIEILSRYRKSFKTYTEGSLSIANLVYALLCAFFIAVFLIKYRIEYVLVFPCIVALFAEYYRLAMVPDSVARKPERLFKAKRLLAFTALTALVFVFCTLVDMPTLASLTEQSYIHLNEVS